MAAAYFKMILKKFENLYHLKKFSDGFDVLGKLLGIDEDLSKKKMVSGLFYLPNFQYFFEEYSIPQNPKFIIIDMLF